MKATVYTSKMGYGNEKAVEVELNKYQFGFYPVAANGFRHQYEIILNGKLVYTMSESLFKAKKQADKLMVDEYIYLNPIS